MLQYSKLSYFDEDFWKSAEVTVNKIVKTESGFIKKRRI